MNNLMQENLSLSDTRVETIEQSTAFIKDLNNDVYIVGRNKYGRSMKQWLEKRGIAVKGYIDDFAKESSYDDVPVVRFDHDYNESVIINCIIEGQPMNVKRLIAKTNAAKSSDYFKIQLAFSDELQPIDYMSETNEILEYKDEYNTVFAKLEDERSRKEFEEVLNFRINREIEFMKDFRFRLAEQYFEDFISLQPGSNFVDAGGFDGFTSATFAEKYPGYGKIFYFEPSPESFELSKNALNKVRSVVYFQNGLWNKTEQLRFNSDMGNSSRISDSGEEIINAVSLDDAIKEKVDFIKIDIEGSEQQALAGASETIKKFKPVIAVCVYHRQRDMVEIPAYLLKLNPSYKIYFRHYTQGTCESVMYFI